MRTAHTISRKLAGNSANRHRAKGSEASTRREKSNFRAKCLPKALHVSELERTLRETDAEIDRRVYDLYGLTEEERRAVEESGI